MTTVKPRGKMVNAFNPDAPSELSERERQMVEDRHHVLAPSYRLFYQEPVHIVRGLGTRLWDGDGTEFLDAYNNVVSVGHGRPEVIGAVERQMRQLCTHTRYLHEGILGYANDLLGTLRETMPEAQLMFTCTGSEANDLAVRIAKYHTGHEGVIVTSEAYHGNSDLTAGFSPSLGDRSPLGTWVRQIPAPDSYRIRADDIAPMMLQQVRSQIEDLQRRGNGLAAFIVDSIFASDGIFADPTDFLKPVADLVHEAGGLFIADEVQCGFARTGSHMWGHARHHVQPDLMTMGKPMGNGYPVAGVAARPEVVAEFGYDQRYFNTFGGNTVAMAAAQATLDVILGEELQANSQRVGALIQAGLNDLAAEYEQLGDVRGSGLYIAAECVTDPETKAPDAQTAAAIVNGMRKRRVLISATGPNANVLKIRPPLVFSEQDVDWLLSCLEQTLREDLLALVATR
ncbi:aspartate aminotransferase family protein [Sinomonas terrae]|uniref:Aspartate aminotransferase family protein n=1 Tax=Sinomonas terrae TaxID=2908838 RepID=A0ABS9U761_9MICC|nr:aspartate aminotransferase family protein [Sinomonas terrae]MCH6472440.1 aspartate aminotransferase family protein [Sinomonas terrae]